MFWIFLILSLLQPEPAACEPAEPVVTGQAEYTLVSDEIARRYLLYVPESYDPATPTSLVITLHGFGDSVENFSEITAWGRIAEEEGVLIVYPQAAGTPARWNTGVIFPEFVVDDLAFIDALIDDLQATYCIDPDRVYVNGFSNGGGMTELLMCNLSERFAAAAIVSGAVNPDFSLCDPAQPVPLIAFHGTDDQVVPYLGQTDGFFDLPPAPQWIASWAGRNGCESINQSARRGQLDGWTFRNCEADVIFYVLEDAGHTWPGAASRLDIAGDTSEDLNGTEAIWAFFQTRARNQP
jgi:polyhydroxybutyrate depolymerase